jgi:predicted dehydrogenase/threonine dehydrogenase-like Zn-dependent dehydrogenase
VKQIAQYQDGRLELQEVPVPTAPPGGVLVRLTHSVISVGTERMKVEQAKMNLLQKARARPDQVRKVLDSARTLGWKAAMEKVRNRLEMPTPLGYSAAGIVIAVDPANTRFSAGDRVAVGGAECAFHAEQVAVPDMLAVKVPDSVPNWQAAYTTIVSIALQTVRQMEARLGERVLVIGQGLVGLLVTNLLHASGVRVMALDVAPSREKLARQMGAERVVIAGVHDLAQNVREWTEGYGVDGVVLATAVASNKPTEQAIETIRDRGRIVIVGNTKTDLPWKDAFAKEIEVRYARSYGPGRYDPSYEWGGADYPIGYVRWTEQRNFEACLHLMSTGALNLQDLTTRRLPFSQSLDIYKALASDEPSTDVGIVLEYGDAQGTVTSITPPATAQMAARRAAAAAATQTAISRIQPASRLDVIGAGNFARTMLLPHAKGVMPLGTVVNNTALSANHVKTKFGFAKASTEPSAAFDDAGSAAVLIATRHNLHAPLVKAALEKDRHVFVEKPLCLTREEMTDIESTLAKSSGTVHVGFNRRFAPAAIELKKKLGTLPGPKTIHFQVMCGALDPAHWYANYAESGGRVLGEACHFLDFFCFLTDSAPVRVSAQTIWPVTGRLPFPDSVTAQVEFADGSCAQLIYSANGDSSWPKEICTVFGAGLVAQIENFQKLAIHQGRKRTEKKFDGKGHAQQMTAWLDFVQGKSSQPIGFADIRQSMALTFAVLESIQQGRAVEMD